MRRRSARETAADEARRLVGALSEELRYGVNLTRAVESLQPDQRAVVGLLVTRARSARTAGTDPE